MDSFQEILLKNKVKKIINHTKNVFIKKIQILKQAERINSFIIYNINTVYNKLDDTLMLIN